MAYLFKGLPNYRHSEIPDISNISILLKKVYPKGKENEKKALFEKIVKLNINSQLKEIHAKIKSTIDNLKEKYISINFEMKTKTRLIVGFGSPSTLETSILLDNVLGIPYIPGSSLKGCFRNYVKIYLNDNSDLKKQIKLIFGSEKDNDDNNIEGNLFFYNSYPVAVENQSNIFDIDVINVHYQDYYAGNEKKPNEYKNPIPINFLCIRPGVKFKFYLFLKNKLKDLKDDIEMNFKNMLKDHGVGAKTNIDFGYFE